MHEMSLCEGVLRILQKQAELQDFSRVKTVWLEMGEMSCAEPESMLMCFEAVTHNTLAEDAKLEIIRTPGQAWCMECSKTVPVRQRYDPCPECGASHVQVTGGDALRVKELEVD